jgi:type IV pilus assembly protein PilC
MTTFAYTAVALDGRAIAATHKAASRAEAELALFAKGLRNIQLTEKKSLLQAEVFKARVKREEIMHLSRQLGAFIRAGLPVLDAVRTLGDEATNTTVRRMMRDVEDGLRRGERLSDCFDRHPDVFPEYYRGILRSAELTGQLDSVLEQLARYLERDLEARRKIKSALIYPAMIAVMSVVTIVVLVAFVLPRFKSFFASLNATLPLPTRILLATTDFLTTWWWALLAGTAAASLLATLIVQTEGGRYRRDQFFLAVPVLGPTIRYTLVERFCRILASMAVAGVPLPEALRVATASLRNQVFIRALGRIGEAMLRGEGLAAPLAAASIFPPTASRMLRVGEDTGTLDTQLEATATYYAGELEYKIKKLTSLFEPVVIIVMGGIVGFVAVAMVWAMYGIFGQVHV